MDERLPVQAQAPGTNEAKDPGMPADPSWFQREPCPVCGFPLGIVRGSKTAVCQNCGFKDGCC
jgi:hypothetical protein